MLKKIAVFVFAGLLLLNIYGCVALLAGAAGGVGTKVWLSGKLSQEFQAPYDRAVTGAKKGLQSLDLDIIKETKEADVAQFKSVYSDGREIWVDVRKLTENSSKVEIRVGGVKADKEAAEKILKAIGRYI